MKFIPLASSSLREKDTILFITYCPPGPFCEEGIQTLHLGWVEEHEFYSECDDTYYDSNEVTHVMKIDNMPSMP